MPDATISATGLRVVKLLVGHRPQTVAELMRSTGVTRTAVTEQLNELVEMGFVERSTERLSGRGRPRHLFRATEAALLLLFSNGQRLVVPAIWRAIAEIGGNELMQKVLRRVSQQIADYYRRRITAKKPEDRLRQFVDQLTAEGALVEVIEEEDGEVRLYRRSCPFISMVDDERSVCWIDQEVVSKVVGQPVRRVSCRHEGDPCCRFEIEKADRPV